MGWTRGIVDEIPTAITTGSGKVWFKTRDIHDDGSVEICIGNDGPSISPEDLPHVFNPTFSKGKRGGTGLGLAVAHKFVTGHGGAIRCTSSENEGTQFYLTLPAASKSLINSAEVRL